MPEEPHGEKTEQPTPRKLEEAWQKGQFARSAEIQTAAMLGTGLLALMLSGSEIWRRLGLTMAGTLGHLHEIRLTSQDLQSSAIHGLQVLSICLTPLAVGLLITGVLSSGVQSRFRLVPEALEINWERLNPVAGLKRLFNPSAAVPLVTALLKLTVIFGFTYQVIRGLFDDPIFTTPVDLRRVGGFLAEAAYKIVARVTFALAALAALDYGYQFWKTHRDLMMTREELKEEAKEQEANPHMRSRQRRRRNSNTQRKMLLEVPKADVVVTNPTHLAVALRYDRRHMKAPRVVAKGSRLNALRIREIAAKHQVPVMENKPLARFLFKHTRVGGEIPPQVYAAVAEILAYVYRVNAFRYYRERSLE